MKRNVFLRKAISLAMCMTFALAFFTGCDSGDDSKGGRDGFIGTWKITTERVGTVLTDSDYTTNITKSSTNSSDILINNILNFGAEYTVSATVNGNSFTIPQQSVQGIGFSGSGVRNGNSMSYSVQVTATGSAIVNWTVECIKM